MSNVWVIIDKTNWGKNKEENNSLMIELFHIILSSLIFTIVTAKFEKIIIL